MLQAALDCIERGWHVFPCRPKTKEPAVQGGFKAATLDEAKVREWWARWPEANVGIATGASGLTVLDIDHGVDSEQDLEYYAVARGLTETLAVRTGRRPGFGVQLYYRGGDLKSIAWKDTEALEESEWVSGDIRSATGYVMAAGSIHPSGEAYEVITFAPVAETPAFVRGLRAERGAGVPDDGEPITSARNNALTSIAGKLRNAGLSAAAMESALIQVNADRCQPPLPEGEVKRIAANAGAWAMPEDELAVTIGKGAEATGAVAVEVVPERKRPQFMTMEDFDNAKPPEFLIDGFLVKEAMCMLAGPVAQRKTIVAMNVVRALCTGEALFGHFAVTNKPARVYYLCPEMGASSFCKRMRQLGLRDYVGKSLFCLTLNQPPIELEDLEDVAGSVIVVDTLTRYVQGNENDSTDMRVFAQRVMAMNRAGATVVLLHHSTKGSSGSLDAALRGSSELAAFVTSCWVTALEDTKTPYKSRSTMANVKQRDFESEPFFLLPVADSFLLEYGGKDEPEAKVGMRQAATEKAELAARELFDADPGISVRMLRAALSERGQKKGTDWVRQVLTKFKGTGVASG